MREAFLAGNYQVKMDYGEVTQLSELKFSPFKDRICRVSLVSTGFKGVQAPGVLSVNCLGVAFAASVTDEVSNTTILIERVA